MTTLYFVMNNRFKGITLNEQTAVDWILKILSNENERIKNYVNNAFPDGITINDFKEVKPEDRYTDHMFKSAIDIGNFDYFVYETEQDIKSGDAVYYIDIRDYKDEPDKFVLQKLNSEEELDDYLDNILGGYYRSYKKIIVK